MCELTYHSPNTHTRSSNTHHGMLMLPPPYPSANPGVYLECDDSEDQTDANIFHCQMWCKLSDTWISAPQCFKQTASTLMMEMEMEIPRSTPNEAKSQAPPLSIPQTHTPQPIPSSQNQSPNTTPEPKCHSTDSLPRPRVRRVSRESPRWTPNLFLSLSLFSLIFLSLPPNTKAPKPWGKKAIQIWGRPLPSPLLSSPPLRRPKDRPEAGKSLQQVRSGSLSLSLSLRHSPVPDPILQDDCQTSSPTETPLPPSLRSPVRFKD